MGMFTKEMLLETKRLGRESKKFLLDFGARYLYDNTRYKHHLTDWEIDNDNVIIYTNYYVCGDCDENDSYTIPIDVFFLSDEQIKAYYHEKREAKAKAKKEKEAKEKEEAAIENERRERQIYEELKKKFEGKTDANV